MKQKKTLSIETWLIEEIMRRFPRARHNFSGAVEGLLIASINNPLQYWRSQAKYYKQKFDLSLQMVQHFKAMETEQEKEHSHLEARNETLLSAIKKN